VRASSTASSPCGGHGGLSDPLPLKCSDCFQSADALDKKTPPVPELAAVVPLSKLCQPPSPAPPPLTLAAARGRHPLSSPTPSSQRCAFSPAPPADPPLRYAFAAVSRLYNGDLNDTPPDAAAEFLHLAALLHPPPPTVEEALHDAIARCVAVRYRGGGGSNSNSPPSQRSDSSPCPSLGCALFEHLISIPFVSVIFFFISHPPSRMWSHSLSKKTLRWPRSPYVL
jgi:hypothetical protein